MSTQGIFSSSATLPYQLLPWVGPKVTVLSAAFFSRSPSSRLIPQEGRTKLLKAGANLPALAALLTKITPLAPWLLATVAFSSKVVVPRFTTTNLPFRSAAPVMPAAA